MIPFVVVLLMLAGWAPTAQAGGRPVFTGEWVSIDAWDGTSQMLTFAGSGSTLRVRLFDTGSNACQIAEGVPGPIVGTGFGDVDGYTVHAVFDFVCLRAGTAVSSVGFDFVFNPDTGTLTDFPDVPGVPSTTWYRSGRA